MRWGALGADEWARTAEDPPLGRQAMRATGIVDEATSDHLFRTVLDGPLFPDTVTALMAGACEPGSGGDLLADPLANRSAGNTKPQAVP